MIATFEFDYSNRHDALLAGMLEKKPLPNLDLGEIIEIAQSAKSEFGVAFQGQEIQEKSSGTYGANLRKLTPEQAEMTLQTLAARFAANKHLHEEVEWTRVKASLEAKPEALWSINEMEKTGHEPDVYNFDERGFDIGTCSKESPASGRNCVYDEEAAELLRKNYPAETFNDSAVAMAEAMGINLMDPDLYENVLQRKGKFDMQTVSWLLTQLDIRSTGDALRGFRDDHGVYVYRYRARNHGDYRSWRGSLRVEWAA